MAQIRNSRRFHAEKRLPWLVLPVSNLVCLSHDAPPLHSQENPPTETHMPDDEPDKVWDEYDWERFLQQQDRKTEKYMELLERYIDDPDRDQIIAREMGWNHLLHKEGQEWAENVDSQFSAENLEAEEESAEPSDERAFSFEVHPLYQSAFTLAAWIDQMLEECGESIVGHAGATNLAAQTSLVSAKLAAALSDDDIDELGMTIAYLKRALRGVTSCLESAMLMHRDELISLDRFKALNKQLFQVRDGIVTLMGDYRAEWRRRFQA